MLAELIDVPATNYDLIGLVPQHTHFGRSLLPVVRGERNDHRDAVFCEGGRLPGEACAMELESADSQKPASLYWPRVALQHDDIAHGKAVMVRTTTRKYVRRMAERDELYDLVADPGEQRNRIDDPALSGDLTALRTRMLDHFVAAADAVPWAADRRW